MRRLIEATLRVNELTAEELHLASGDELPEGITLDDLNRLRQVLGDANMKCKDLLKTLKYGA